MTMTMSDIRLLIPVCKEYYYKIYYYSPSDRKIFMFLFPRPGLTNFYLTERIFEYDKQNVIKILHKWKLLNMETRQWCSGEQLTDTVSNDTVFQCERVLNGIFTTMDDEVICQLCSTNNNWKTILGKDAMRKLPICECCKALLVV